MDTKTEPDTSHTVDRKTNIAEICFEGHSIDNRDTATAKLKDANEGYFFEVPIMDQINIKKEIEEEEDEEDSQKCEDEVPDDASCSKAEHFEGGECSYSDWMPHQFLQIEIDPATKNDKPSPPNKKQPVTDEDEVKQIILRQEIVAQVALRREEFHLRNFVCDVCYNVFAFSRSLKMHQPVHKKPRSRRRYGSADKPVQVHFHLSRRILKCDRCEFKCDNIIALKLHKIQHIDERPFKCDECDFKCRYSAHLKLHKFKHVRGTPFNCEHCDYKTAQSSHFKAHMLSHTGEKPLQCDKCDYKCAYSSSLKFHKASHSDEKPYKCEQCYYQTAHRDYLKRHMMTHTGEKPYQCDLCDYKAIRSSHLKTHKLTHTGEKPYVCDRCDSKYACMKSLKRHKMLHSDLKL